MEWKRGSVISEIPPLNRRTGLREEVNSVGNVFFHFLTELALACLPFSISTDFEWNIGKTVSMTQPVHK